MVRHRSHQSHTHGVDRCGSPNVAFGPASTCSRRDASHRAMSLPLNFDGSPLMCPAGPFCGGENNPPNQT